MRVSLVLFNRFVGDCRVALCERRRTAIACSFVLACVVSAAPLIGTDQPIRYLLDLREPGSHLVRVTMEVPEAAAGTELQFPAWNALYQIRDFSRNVQELDTQCDERQVELQRVDLHTWRSAPVPCRNLVLRYRVYANEESVFSAVLNNEHAFLNLALLLFYLPRERGRPTRAKFLLPEGWKLATMLEETAEPDEFAAPDYDTLVDSPVEAGSFQEYQYAQSGATYRVVVHADPDDYSSDRLLKSLKKITAVQTDMMGGAPFRRYTFILHFPRGRGGGGMEHRDGTAISYPAGDVKSNWTGLEFTLAHEFFHVWNVKRIRPQNLEPVDYIHGNDTRDLWFAEGVDSTYTWLFVLRAGLIDRRTFYLRLGAEIQTLQDRPARRFQSVEQAGIEAWLEKYPDYFRPIRSISYYNKGALLGFLLDLAIRHASAGRHSLDDVMRRLNADFAHRGRFFTEADLRAIISELAPAFDDLDAFFDDYISGRRELDYDTYLGYAGLRLVVTTDERPSAGFSVGRLFDERVVVEDVAPESPAAAAGLEPGDILLSLNGRKLSQSPQDRVDRLKRGQRIRLQVRRRGREFRLEFPMGTSRAHHYSVEEIEHPSEEQRRLREAWLAGRTEAARAGK